jgi:hypothetical protein
LRRAGRSFSSPRRSPCSRSCCAASAR